jgi:hypothetical protein
MKEHQTQSTVGVSLHFGLFHSSPPPLIYPPLMLRQGDKMQHSAIKRDQTLLSIWMEMVLWS